MGVVITFAVTVKFCMESVHIMEHIFKSLTLKNSIIPLMQPHFADLATVIETKENAV